MEGRCATAAATSGARRGGPLPTDVADADLITATDLLGAAIIGGGRTEACAPMEKGVKRSAAEIRRSNNKFARSTRVLVLLP